MTREQVLAILRTNESGLRAEGIVCLSLFGSTARGDQNPTSDVDLLAAFDSSRKLSLLDIIRIQHQLAGLLGQPVDLMEEGTLKPRVQARAAAEAVRAF